LEGETEEATENDALGRRKDPMGVDDSDGDDNDDNYCSLGFKTHFEIETAFRKVRVYAKKKGYPDKAL
jgi:hypothetical protein